MHKTLWYQTLEIENHVYAHIYIYIKIVKHIIELKCFTCSSNAIVEFRASNTTQKC